MNNIEELLRSDAEFESLTTDELLLRLQHRSAFTRARALGALARRSINTPELYDQIIEAIAEPRNLAARTVGTVTVSQFGLAVLLATGTPEAQRRVARCLETWPAADRPFLEAFLRSANLAV